MFKNENDLEEIKIKKFQKNKSCIFENFLKLT